MDSIFTSIKKLLGGSEEDTNFDTDIIMDINSALMSVNQLGIGPDTGFVITGKNEIWSQLLGDRKDLEGVKTYIFLKVKLMFDPPSSSFVLESINNQITEFEWRLNSQAEKIEVVPVVEEGGVTGE
jgi:hypothetical protein